MHITKDHLPWETGNLPTIGGNLWICPECGAINAYNHEDAERALRKIERVGPRWHPVPHAFSGGFRKVEVVVCSGSCFDNICGSCHSNIVQPNSPILAPCYTHSED